MLAAASACSAASTRCAPSHQTKCSSSSCALAPLRLPQVRLHRHSWRYICAMTCLCVLALLTATGVQAARDERTGVRGREFISPYLERHAAAPTVWTTAERSESGAVTWSELGGAAPSLLASASSASSTSSDFKSEVSGSSSSSSALPPITTTAPPPTTSPPPPPPTTARPRIIRKAAHLSLLGLLALLVVVVAVGVAVWCICRRNRNRRRVRSLRLNGTRRPGEVDDADMGQAVKGGDWLHLDSAEGATQVVGAARRSRFTTSLDALQTSDAVFDPIGQQAADARKRKCARRVAVAAAEGTDNGDARGAALGGGGGAGVFGFGAGATQGNEPGAGESDTWSSEEGDSENGGGVGGSGGAGTGAAARGPIYASSMALPGAGGGGSGGPPTAMVPPLALTPQYFNDTTKVLMDRYNTESDGFAGHGGVGQSSSSAAAATTTALPSTVAAGGRGGSLPNHTAAANTTENTAFEHILSSAVAPLRVGEEFHQRGGSLLPDEAAAKTKGGAAVPAGQAGHSSEEEMEDYEGEEEEEEEEEDAHERYPVRGQERRRGDAPAFDNAIPSDGEAYEEEEEEAPPTRGRAAVAPSDGRANRSLR